jgi:hypothetical protein
LWHVWFLSLVEEDWSRIRIPRCEQQYPLPALRKAKRKGVDDSIGPGVATFLEVFDEPGHRLAAIQREHEGDVLQQQPLRPWRRLIEQPENVLHQPRL